MHSRRNKIMKNCQRASKRFIVTDIDKIFERWCDFSEYKDIYYSQTQYSNNFRVAAQSCSFQQIESMLEKNDKKSKNNPMYRLGKKPLLTSKQRQLVNVGFDEEANFNIINPDYLYCHEELSHSVNQETEDAACENDLRHNEEPLLLDDLENNTSKVPIDSGNKITSPLLKQHLSQVDPLSDTPKSIDPYADSDDENDKDYNPEEELNCSASSDETICQEDKQETELRVLKPLQVKNVATRQFNTNCDQHQSYTTIDNDTSYKEKVSNINDTNLSPINTYDSKNETENTGSCEYKSCKEEVFSTCGKCLCYEHFISETTYNDCKNHTLMQSKRANQTQDKVKQSALKIANKQIDEDTLLTNKNITLAGKDTTQTDGDTILTDKDITHTNRDILLLQADIDILQTDKDPLQTDTTEAYSNKGWTKKGNPRKRRKIEESKTERKKRKIKIETEKLTVRDPCTYT